MRLGAFSVVDAYPDLPEAEDRLGAAVRLGVTAEAGGLASFWVAEHHFHYGGACPSPPVLLAACGARTRRIRLGSLVSVVPFHRPVDLAEEYAELDRLLGGRLNLGVGSGYLPQEFDGFGVDPATKRERFDTGLATMLDAWAGREVRVDTPGASAVRLNVVPVQKPHPPIWIAVQRREAIPFVARRGSSLALIPYATARDRNEVADEVSEYRSHLAPESRGEVAVALHVYAGDRLDLARHALDRYLSSRLDSRSTFLAEKVRGDPSRGTAEGVEAGGFALFGPPSRVADELERWAETGVDEVLGIFDFGALPEEEVHRSVLAAGKAWASRAGTGRGPSLLEGPTASFRDRGHRPRRRVPIRRR